MDGNKKKKGWSNASFRLDLEIMGYNTTEYRSRLARRHNNNIIIYYIKNAIPPQNLVFANTQISLTNRKIDTQMVATILTIVLVTKRKVR